MTEEEMINKDGEEVIEYFGETSRGEHAMYFVAGLFALIPLVYGIVFCVKQIFKWLGMGV